QAFQFYGDTWTWDGTDWTRHTPSVSPSSRWGPGLGYDPISNLAVLFGGDDLTGPLGDTWTWDGTNWTQVFPATSPEPRFHFPFAFSPIGQMILFGGNGADVYGDTWGWDGSNWILH